MTCPVRSLQAWLESARITHGPVFRSLDRFQTGTAREAVGQSCRVGLDPARYAGHSLRAGLATSAARQGRLSG